MLLTTLLQIKPILAKQLNKETTEAVLNFLKNYKCGMYIYPGVFKRKFNISIEEIYSLLNEMEKIGVLQSYYELVCSRCQKVMGTVRLFNELPDSFVCELCGEELPTLSNSVLIYKVVVKGQLPTTEIDFSRGL